MAVAMPSTRKQLAAGKRIKLLVGVSGEAECSGLLIPDTDLGENVRHREVSDEQATTYVFPGV